MTNDEIAKRAKEIEARRADIQEKRDAVKAELDLAAAEQRLADEEALFDLEQTHGHYNVLRIDVDPLPGLPTLVVVRAPNEAEFKRYRAGVKPQKDRDGDMVLADVGAAVDQLGAVCRVYPDKETFEKMLAHRVGLKTQCGNLAVKLMQGVQAREGKA